MTEFKNKKFDTKVQVIKYKALKEVAKLAWNGELLDHVMDIPQTIIPGNKPTMRCCVYKERAILGERVKIAMGGDKNTNNAVQVIPIACDECPIGGYEVTNACRGCLAKRCLEACKFGAITIDENQISHIDKSKCKECGACAKVCPYSAIVHRVRPCINACKVKAISMNEDNVAVIDDEKCTSCGACVYQCPFGAITDKSYILNAIKLILESENNTKYKVYAVIAPSISSQFTYAKLGQVVTGLEKLGFYTVVEAALGADMVSEKESKELVEKGFLISSCCPAFVSMVEKNFPQYKDNISHSLSPMAEIAKYIKTKEPTAKVIFIGPCTAKKEEIKKDTVKPYVDCAITFEELQALFASKDLDISTLEEGKLYNASLYGRNFARCGGLADAVREGIKEQGCDFNLKAISCDGIEECKLTLLKKSKNLIDVNFIEGMACVGGCVGGAGCLTHGEHNKIDVEKFGAESDKKTIADSINAIEDEI